jgi:hypothetical protein
MNGQLDDALGRYHRLEEAAIFFLWDAFEHTYLAAQLEVAGLIFGERIINFRVYIAALIVAFIAARCQRPDLATSRLKVLAFVNT